MRPSPLSDDDADTLGLPASPILVALGEDTSAPASNVSENEIKGALDRLLADKRLRLSDRNRRFLRFVVEEKLAGRDDRIKSYAVAVDVFGRGENFDGTLDPIVRIEASRLRAALASYYEGPGAGERLRIFMPRGGYVPDFRVSRTTFAAAKVAEPPGLVGRPTSARKSSGYRLIAAGLLGGILALGSMLFAIWPKPDRTDLLPIIAVEPVRNLASYQDGDDIALGLTQSLISSLSRFSVLRPVYLGDVDRQQVSALAKQHAGAPIYVVSSSVRLSPSALRFWWSVVNSRTTEILWSENLDLERSDGMAQTIEDRIAGRVAAQLAEPNGVVGAEHIQTAKILPGYGQGYGCVLQARAQYAAPRPDRHALVRRCLEQTVGLEPDYADAWAMLALIYLYEARPLTGNADDPDLNAMGLQAAQRAAQLAPLSGPAYEALMIAYFRKADFAAADAASARALELNPNDPDILYASGLRAYARGRWEEGIGKIRRSMDLGTRIRPGAYFVLALDAYRRAEYMQALDHVTSIEDEGLPLPHVLSAAIYTALGKQEQAQTQIDEALRLSPDYGQRLSADLARLHFVEELSDLVIAGARRAGLTPSPASASSPNL